MKNNLQQNPFEKFRVLIADDNPVDRALLKAQLEDMGFLFIQEAQNGSEGLFKIQNAAKVGKPFTLIITDWKMPEKDGLSLVKFLGSFRDTKRPKVIMLTAVSESGKVKEAIVEGVDDFVLKPIDVEILKSKLLKIVSQKSAA